VYTPWHSYGSTPYLQGVKANPGNRILTLGDFILGVYNTCDEREAAAIVWLAIHAGLLVVHGDAAWIFTANSDILGL
jgi:hypothetical protein